MTFGVSRDHGLFEWIGIPWFGIRAEEEHILTKNVAHDLRRSTFQSVCLGSLAKEDDSEPYVHGIVYENGNGYHEPERLETIRDYLEREGYSEAFRDNYLIPTAAAVWSTGPDKCSLDFPAVTLVQFMWSHHILTTDGTRPQWPTLKYGAKSYIDAVMKCFLQTTSPSVPLSRKVP